MLKKTLSALFILMVSQATAHAAGIEGKYKIFWKDSRESQNADSFLNILHHDSDGKVSATISFLNHKFDGSVEGNTLEIKSASCYFPSGLKINGREMAGKLICSVSAAGSVEMELVFKKID